MGNEMTDTGTANPGSWDGLHHTIYVYGRRDQPSPYPERYRDLGWNYLWDNRAARAINIYNGEPNSNNPISDHTVHDNVIVNQEAEAILLGNGVVGTNTVYNNLIVNGGLHKVDPSSSSGLTCVTFKMSDPPGVSIPHDPTVAILYNNIVLNCGASGGSSSHTGVLDIQTSNVKLLNNIFYQQSVTYPYVTSGSRSVPSGRDATKYNTNLWYGAGSPPSWDTSPVNADPLLVSARGTYNLHLRVGSAAIGAGTNLTSSTVGVTDFDGVSRPPSGAWEIGAYQFRSTVSATPSARLRDRSSLVGKGTLR